MICEYLLFCLLQSLFDHIPVGVGSKGVIPMNAKYVNTYTCCIYTILIIIKMYSVYIVHVYVHVHVCIVIIIVMILKGDSQFYNNNYCVEYIICCTDKCMVPYGRGDCLRTCMWQSCLESILLVCLGPQEVCLGSFSG